MISLLESSIREIYIGAGIFLVLAGIKCVCIERDVVVSLSILGKKNNTLYVQCKERGNVSRAANVSLTLDVIRCIDFE